MTQDPERGAPAAAPISPFPLRAGLAHSELPVRELWMHYIGMGGTLSAAELEAVLHGEPVEPREYDVIAQVLNEWFSERGGDHPVAYADEVDAPDPRPVADPVPDQSAVRAASRSATGAPARSSSLHSSLTS